MTTGRYIEVGHLIGGRLIEVHIMSRLYINLIQPSNYFCSSIKMCLFSSGMKTMVNRGRFLHTVSVGPDVSMGEENSRERVAQLMHRLVGESC